MVVKSVVVNHFWSRKAITAAEANQANAVVLAAVEADDSEGTDVLFTLTKRQNAEILQEDWPVKECGVFLDHAFSNNWASRDGIPELFVKAMQAMSASIGWNLVRNNQVASEFVSKALSDWTAVACIVGQEIAYGAGLTNLIQVHTITPIEDMQRHITKVCKTSGVTFNRIRKDTGYLINSQYECFAGYESDLVYSNKNQYTGYWFNLTESSTVGKYNLTCRKTKGEWYTETKPDGTERRKRDDVGIEPSKSFMRAVYGSVLSRFTTEELGGIASGHQDLAAEFKNTRIAAGQRTSDSDFELLMVSSEFTERDKFMIQALELTVLGSETYNAEVDDVRELLKHTLRNAVTEFRTNFQAIANVSIGERYFRTLVKNLQKKARRYFQKLADSLKSDELDPKRRTLKETFTILPDAVDNSGSVRHIGAGDYALPNCPPIRKDFRVFWNEYLRTVNYCPKVVQTSEPIPVTNFPCNVKLDTVNNAAAEVADDHCFVSHPVGYVDYVLNFSDNSVPNSLTDLERRLVGCGLPKLVKATTPNTTPKTKAWLLWDRLRGEFRRIATVDVACEYADAI